MEDTPSRTRSTLALHDLYRVLVVVADRSAKEKVDILKAYGADVVLAPTTLPKQHPDHLFNVVRRLAEQTPDAWFANQYDNPANPAVHQRTTGPEIWRQTAGRVTHFVAGIGTGGTITGTGEFLKAVSRGAVTVVGADPESSSYSGGDGSPYFVESIGHFVHPDTIDDLWPESFRPAVVDRFERVPDRESLLTARRLAREEGLLAGASSGTAIAAALRVARDLTENDLVVVILPDSGRSYLSKSLSDDWLRQWGFLEEPAGEPIVRDVLGDLGELPTVTAGTTVGEALAGLAALGPGGAVPVLLDRERRPFGIAASEILGSVSAAGLRSAVADGRVRLDEPVSGVSEPSLPTVGVGQPISVAAATLDGHAAAIVLEDGRARAIVTRDQLDTGRPPAKRSA